MQSILYLNLFNVFSAHLTIKMLALDNITVKMQ